MNKYCKIVSLLLCFCSALSAEESAVFFGSPVSCNEIKPVKYTRFDSQGGTDFEDSVVVGYPDYRIALLYTMNRNRPGLEVANELVTPNSTEPVQFYIRGGSTQTEALDKLFGSYSDAESQYGYVYPLEARDFAWQPGLGRKEVVSHGSFAHPVGIQVNRRREFDRLVSEGQIQLHWKP